MTTLQDRIAKLMAETGKTVGEIASIAGVSSSAVTQWKDGPTKSLKTAPATKLAAATGFSAMWIATGSGPEKSGIRPFDVNVKPAPPGMRVYPVISKIQAGMVKEMNCPYEPGDGFAVEFGEDDASPWAFYLEIEGDSMLPEFRPGDRVLIDPEVPPRPGDFVAARNTKQESTFKKYRVRGIGEAGQEVFELVPLNDDYPILRSDEQHLTVIGTMLEHRRKFRRK
ncbi:LexA family protein [Comamonas terrigena]|uniref:LexA family protein n=1 Tax=Comamonas terrigena TaxID=32013 RepID=UPI00244A7890|nr:S24 family peptidase [Comamonas terrigena]MDH1700300.1 peptidase S24 [Comamonas terrigena]